MKKWSFLLILTGFVLSLMCAVSSDAKEYSYKGETLDFSKGVLRNYKGTLCLAVSEKNCKELLFSMIMTSRLLPLTAPDTGTVWTCLSFASMSTTCEGIVWLGAI